MPVITRNCHGNTVIKNKKSIYDCITSLNHLGKRKIRHATIEATF